MSKVKLAFLLVGIFFFAWALQAVELTMVLELLIKMGYGFLLIFLIYGAVTWVDTVAWKNNFKPDQACRFSLFQLWRIRQIGEAYNTITPLGTLGGEPVKAQLLKDHHGLSFKQGLASLVIARTTFLTALILFMIPGIVFIFQSRVIPADFKSVSLVGIIVFTTLVFLFFLFQLTGILGRLTSWAGRVFPKISEHGFLHQLQVLDKLMSSYYRECPSRAGMSIIYALTGWVMGLAELYAILYFLGFNPSLAELWIIEALGQLVRVGSFFIPLNLGALEGGLILIFTAIGMPAHLGLAVSFVSRIKQLLWVGAGLIMGGTLAFKPADVQPEASEG